jgi:4-amino-4-deoxy-L-arabinose transferase-like glycosyltransferase
VNPEAMLVAVTAAALFLLARAFRRGLTSGLAVAIGVVMAIGFITKLNFLGLAPGLVIGLLVLAARPVLRDRVPLRHAIRAPAIAIAIAAIPIVYYLFSNLVEGHEVLGSVAQIGHPTGGHGTIFDEASYVWQFFLPRLPGMSTDFHGLAPWRAIWFNRSVGLYGWLDTPLPLWLYDLALIPAILLAVLAIRELFVGRHSLRRRLGELAAYAAMVVGMLVLIGSPSYLHFPGQAGTYGEPRYLLSLIPLAGVIVALAARGTGRRFGPAAGVLIVVLFLGWDIFSQLQVVARFYG